MIDRTEIDKTKSENYPSYKIIFVTFIALNEGTISPTIMATCVPHSLHCHGGSSCYGMVPLSFSLTASKNCHDLQWPLTTLLFLYWGHLTSHPVFTEISIGAIEFLSV